MRRPFSSGARLGQFAHEIGRIGGLRTVGDRGNQAVLAPLTPNERKTFVRLLTKLT